MTPDRDFTLPDIDWVTLAKCLGIKQWSEDVKNLSWFEHVAAILIIEANERKFKSNPYFRDNRSGVAIFNASFWIKYAYDMGREDALLGETKSGAVK